MSGTHPVFQELGGTGPGWLGMDREQKGGFPTGLSEQRERFAKSNELIKSHKDIKARKDLRS